MMSQQQPLVLCPESPLTQHDDLNGIPVSDIRIHELFTALEDNNAGSIPLEVVKRFYDNLEHFGLDLSDWEVENRIAKYSSIVNGALTYEEFSCFILALAQW